MDDGLQHEGVLIEQSGAVTTVRINRPDRYNALNLAAKNLLRDTLLRIAEDDTVRAVVLTGTGKAFCVGQDLAEHAESLGKDDGSALDTVAVHYNPIVTAITTMPKPVIAAVNGAAFGAGFSLALAADLRIISSAATFGTAFTGIGLTADSGLSWTLPRAVGDARARELLLLGATLDAQQAVEWGIAGQLVDPDELDAVTAGLAGRLAAGPTLAYAASKRLLALGASVPLSESLAAEGVEQNALGETSDHRDAVTAFMSKQRPTFNGR